MERTEKARLLSSGTDSEESNGQDGSYGTDKGNPDQRETPADGATETHTINSATNGDTNGSRSKRPWWKRERLQRNPSLDKVDEDVDFDHETQEEVKKKRSSKDGLFGVRSYLHHFYEDHLHVQKDPRIYEEDDFAYLLGNPHRRRCTSIWWKIFVWIGANFLIFGIIGVLVGYLVPQKPVFVGKITEHMYVEDHSAVNFNFNLDVCKLVGLILFCIGGITLAVALLFPSFLYHYCEDDRRDSSFKVLLGDEKPATSPLEMQIPASSLIAGIQPERKSKESVVTKEGMLPYSD